jgi:hypothetical protein
LFVDGPAGPATITVRPDGAVFVRPVGDGAAWRSTPSAGADHDGTLNDATDDDEEWVIELAIPLRELGLEGKAGEHLWFSARRCDTPKSSRRTCSAAGGEAAIKLVLE